jgi:hypothetical protein
LFNAEETPWEPYIYLVERLSTSRREGSKPAVVFAHYSSSNTYRFTALPMHASDPVFSKRCAASFVLQNVGSAS